MSWIETITKGHPLRLWAILKSKRKTNYGLEETSDMIVVGHAIKNWAKIAKCSTLHSIVMDNRKEFVEIKWYRETPQDLTDYCIECKDYIFRSTLFDYNDKKEPCIYCKNFKS